MIEIERKVLLNPGPATTTDTVKMAQIVPDICLNSLLPEGNKILIINNGAYSSRGAEICSYYGLDHINLKLLIDRQPDLVEIEKVLQENPEIALVYTTHHEAGTGLD